MKTKTKQAAAMKDEQKNQPVKYMDGTQIIFSQPQCHCAVIGNHLYTRSGFCCSRDRVVAIELRTEDVLNPVSGEYYAERWVRDDLNGLTGEATIQPRPVPYTHVIQIAYRAEDDTRQATKIEVRGEDTALHLLSDLMEAAGQEMEAQLIEKRAWLDCRLTRKMLSDKGAT